MLVCRGGTEVGKGTYWNLRNGRRIDVDGDACLPGGDASRYIRSRAAMLLVVGPLIGLLYAVLFPFISLGVVLSAAVRKASGNIISLLAKNISFHWMPKNAYLAGKKKEKKENNASK